MSGEVVWLVGRGVSLSCGLAWDVPPGLYDALRRGEIDRKTLIARIREGLSAAQDAALASGCDTLAPLERLLAALYRSNAREDWVHHFVTTNWDTLLDRATGRCREPDRPDIRPSVQHLNGSIERGDDGTFLTEADSQDARDAALEAHPGFQQLLRANVCVLAGMSLKSPADKELVARLGTRQGWMPAGEHWLVVNHDARQIAHVSDLLREHLPRSAIGAVKTPFDEWVAAGMPELAGLGVLRAPSAPPASREGLRRTPGSPAW